jgi:RND family efflux transporter MFP subunit
MHPQVIKYEPGDCPICHMKLVPMRSDEAAADAKGPRKILYWWDPMLGPSSIADKPGKSAMGMDRVPVYADEASARSGEPPGVTVDPAIVQNMGVRTAAVKRGPLTIAVRAVGMLQVPEPGMRDVSLKVSGWIDTLQADTEGMHIHAGEPLFTLYSPDVVVAEDELIAAEHAAKSLDAGTPVALREQTESLINSAKQKLQLWDIAGDDIDAIAKADHAPRTVIIRSPISGDVIDKSVVAGSAVTAGMKVMRIEDHSHLWLDAEIYANDFAAVAVGQTMEATIEGLPGKTFTGTVSFIYPHVDHMTRTLMVRAMFDNPDATLRPGMYAAVKLMNQPVEDALLVPSDAIIDTGSEQIAFVASGNGHFESRHVAVGRHGDDDVEILSGLAAGESVVTSGQFLLDVESNTKAAIARLNSEKKMGEQR